MTVQWMRIGVLMVFVTLLSFSHAVAVSPCGQPGERACCNGLFEFSNAGGACNTGAAPIPGCFGDCLCGGIGIGQVAVHSCVSAPKACGDEGQRACCVIEHTPACDDGLVEETDGLPDEFFPVAGDATCSNGITTERSSGSCVATNFFPVIPEPDTGWTAVAGPRGGPLRGYLDMHVHLMAHLAHGKKVFAGDPAPINSFGNFLLDDVGNLTINSALSDLRDQAVHGANGDHGLGRDSVGDGTKDGTRSKFGAPYFIGWPKWTSTTHQQAYYTWLERAWRGGLRAITLLAVTNEALCKSTNDEADWPTLCERSMISIDEQLVAARDFERFIDEIAGAQFSDGKGWFRIVETPAQARQVIAGGRLAVVLGIEVDNLFNCKEQNTNRPTAPCPDLRDANGNAIKNAAGELIDTVAKAVAHYHVLGVRHIFPVHNFDNAFGAAATWQDVIGVGQAVSEQRWWEVEDCDASEYGFWIDNFLFPLINSLGFSGAIIDPVPPYTNGNLTDFASCNRYGLNFGATTPGPDKRGLGKELIQALMEHGMLIDVDHMSNHSLNQTLAMTLRAPGSAATPYPVVASHVQFFDLHEKEFVDNKGRHERMRTWAQLEAIRAGGGMIAAMLKDDVQDTGLRGQKFTLAYVPAEGGTIADDCRHSSKTWAQALQYGVDVMGAPVAMGSDFNGIAGHLGPRFGSDACGGWEPFPTDAKAQERVKQERARNRVRYPFTLPGLGTFSAQVTGKRTFDYNVDGLAHIGLLPDLVADLKTIGLSDYYMDMLMCSAEQYIRVWERAEALAAGQPAPDLARPWQCRSPGSVATITVDVTTHPAGSGRTIDFTVAGGPVPITETFQLGHTTTPYTTHDLEPGTYALTVGNVPAGWTRAINCVGGPFGPGAGAGVTYTSGQPIALAGGDSVACIVTDTLRSTAGFCPSNSKIHTGAGSGQWPNNKGMDVVVRIDLGESIQDAVDNAADLNGDGYVLIGVQGKPATSAGGFGSQRVVIRGSGKPFGLVGCSVRLADPAPQDRLPVVHIPAYASAPSLFVMGLYVEGSQAAGYRVEGNFRHIYGAQASGNAVGIEVMGNGNTIELGSYEANRGPGIAVTGNGNTIKGVTAITNGGHGIQVVGNTNKVLGVIAGDNARGNGGDGINLAGRGNEVSRSRVHANRGDGLDVTGGNAAFPNVLRENLVGGQGRGNGGHGIFVHGDVAAAGGTIEIYKNTVKSNARDGIHLDASATGHDFQRNVSGGSGAASNRGCEYAVSAGNFNGGGNKADGVIVAGTNGAFPSGCLGTPP